VPWARASVPTIADSSHTCICTGVCADLMWLRSATLSWNGYVQPLVLCKGSAVCRRHVTNCRVHLFWLSFGRLTTLHLRAMTFPTFAMALYATKPCPTCSCACAAMHVHLPSRLQSVMRNCYSAPMFFDNDTLVAADSENHLLAVSNTKRLLADLDTFYVDGLGLSADRVRGLSAEEIATEKNPAQVQCLAELVLAAAALSEDNTEYIRTIMEMEPQQQRCLVPIIEEAMAGGHGQEDERGRSGALCGGCG